jgi:hypothetical protein
MFQLSQGPNIVIDYDKQHCVQNWLRSMSESRLLPELEDYQPNERAAWLGLWTLWSGKKRPLTLFN